MNRLSAPLLIAAIVALTAPAFADDGGDCHFHGKKPATQDTVSACAVKRQKLLVGSGKIDKAWLAVAPSGFEQVDGKRGKEWKVTFKDPAAADKSKEHLYMFFTAQGNFIAANFTGK